MPGAMRPRGAACISMRKPAADAGSVHGGRETYLFGQSSEQLIQTIQKVLETGKLPAEVDVEGADAPSPGWKVDIYAGKASQYRGDKGPAARHASLARQAEELQARAGWSVGKSEKFIAAAEGRDARGLPLDKELSTPSCDGHCKTTGRTSSSRKWTTPHADLRGLGGAGIPATQKWRDVRDAVRTAASARTDDRAFIVVNGDESEPGTFKDRELLLHAPHLVVEGVILAGLLTEATQGFIYIRHEYPEQIAACEKEIRRAEELGVCGPRPACLGGRSRSRSSSAPADTSAASRAR